ncbi:MAG: hypothetical protein WC307_03725, partial [Candidatus Nanoarchaeia archaeon]
MSDNNLKKIEDWYSILSTKTEKDIFELFNNNNPGAVYALGSKLLYTCSNLFGLEDANHQIRDKLEKNESINIDGLKEQDISKINEAYEIYKKANQNKIYRGCVEGKYNNEIANSINNKIKTKLKNDDNADIIYTLIKNLVDKDSKNGLSWDSINDYLSNDEGFFINNLEELIKPDSATKQDFMNLVKQAVSMIYGDIDYVCDLYSKIGSKLRYFMNTYDEIGITEEAITGQLFNDEIIRKETKMKRKLDDKESLPLLVNDFINIKKSRSAKFILYNLVNELKTFEKTDYNSDSFINELITKSKTMLNGIINEPTPIDLFLNNNNITYKRDEIKAYKNKKIKNITFSDYSNLSKVKWKDFKNDLESLYAVNPTATYKLIDGLTRLVLNNIDMNCLNEQLECITEEEIIVKGDVKELTLIYPQFMLDQFKQDSINHIKTIESNRRLVIDKLKPIYELLINNKELIIEHEIKIEKSGLTQSNETEKYLKGRLDRYRELRNFEETVLKSLEEGYEFLGDKVKTIGAMNNVSFNAYKIELIQSLSLQDDNEVNGWLEFLTTIFDNSVEKKELEKDFKSIFEESLNQGLKDVIKNFNDKKPLEQLENNWASINSKIEYLNENE